MQDLISVIVPVYKVEPYLRRCVDSILNQTYKNLEIILVDDGSPDNCGAICDEYAAKDPRVRVIHKENGGISDTRNAGLDICTGEYISFVDSDDWIEPGHIRSLYSCLQKDNQIAVSDIMRIDEYGSLAATFVYEVKKHSEMEPVFGYVWNKLYPVALLREESFPNINYEEDLLFNFRLMRKKPEYVYTGEKTYCYLLRQNSILMSEVSEKKVSEMILSTQQLWSILNEIYDQEQSLRLYNYYAGNDLCDFLCAIAVSKSISAQNKRKMARQMIKQVSDGRMQWKYASHKLLKLAIIVEKTKCYWLYLSIYSRLEKRRK